jgi:hypothetical protein
MNRRNFLEIPCDISGMETMLRSLDPWDKVLNVPCWMPYMWETILSYGSNYNYAALIHIEQARYEMETLFA